MIFRILSIAIALVAAAGLWFAYDELSVFRRTMFWDYRYIIFGCAAFLALSVLEAAMGWLKTKLGGDSDTH